MIPVTYNPIQDNLDPSADHELAFEFPADPCYLTIVRRLVGDLAALRGFDPDAAHDIQIAADEACANAMQHGCRSGRDRIRICIVCGPEGLVIDVIDWGDGFAIDNHVRRPLREILQSMPSRGMGLPIIRTLMDEVAYEAGTPKGNVLRMRKTREPRAV